MQTRLFLTQWSTTIAAEMLCLDPAEPIIPTQLIRDVL